MAVFFRAMIAVAVIFFAFPAIAQSPPQVRIDAGMVEGSASADQAIRTFTGIPFAAPPVGNYRWKAPQPVQPWEGVRKATAFGARCMQGGQFNDMVFRDPGPSEDCLYLNVWTPARSSSARLPVMVWIYGGGFQAGSSSEPRQDGAMLARKGVVVVSMNYRLGVFGFFSHPELTAETPRHASGNYGLLDQAAALRWVQANIAAFGGDPANVTIFGESAGSISVSAQMASSVAKGMFVRAIGESGGIAEWVPRMESLARSEKTGVAFGEMVGAPTLAALRTIPSEELWQAALEAKDLRLWPNVDGYFFSENPLVTYATGRQAHVPLLAGWNADEHRSYQFFGSLAPTPENYLAKITAEFGVAAPAVLELFPGGTDAEVEASAHDLASVEFITYSTWKWLELQAGGGTAVYRYRFDQPLPPEPNQRRSRGVHHGADIQFVFNTLDSAKLAWTADHRKMADVMSSYWTNFAKTGDPNGKGLPRWLRYDRTTDYAVMHLKTDAANRSMPVPAADRIQFQLLDRVVRERRRGE